MRLKKKKNQAKNQNKREVPPSKKISHNIPLVEMKPTFFVTAIKHCNETSHLERLLLNSELGSKS